MVMEMLQSGKSDEKPMELEPDNPWIQGHGASQYVTAKLKVHDHGYCHVPVNIDLSNSNLFSSLLNFYWWWLYTINL